MKLLKKHSESIIFLIVSSIYFYTYIQLQEIFFTSILSTGVKSFLRFSIFTTGIMGFLIIAIVVTKYIPNFIYGKYVNRVLKVIAFVVSSYFSYFAFASDSTLLKSHFIIGQSHNNFPLLMLTATSLLIVAIVIEHFNPSQKERNEEFIAQENDVKKYGFL